MKNMVYGVASRLPDGDKIGMTSNKARIVKRYAAYPLTMEFYVLTFSNEKEARLCIEQTRKLSRGEIIPEEELVKPLFTETYC